MAITQNTKRKDKALSLIHILRAEKDNFPARLQAFGYKELEVCL